MTVGAREDLRLETLAKASRRAAFVSLGGFLLIVGAMSYAALQLRALEQARTSAQAEVAGLRQQVQHYGNEVTRLQLNLARVTSDLKNARSALSSARAAITAFHEGRLDEAVHLYDEALASDPDNAYLQNLRAYSLFRLGRLGEAIQGERLSISADPGYAWGYLDMARFLCAGSPEQHNEAREMARRAIALRPEMRAVMKGDGEFQRVCRGTVP